MFEEPIGIGLLEPKTLNITTIDSKAEFVIQHEWIIANSSNDKYKTIEESDMAYFSTSQTSINTYLGAGNYKSAFGLFILVVNRLDNYKKYEIINYYKRNISFLGEYSDNDNEVESIILRNTVNINSTWPTKSDTDYVFFSSSLRDIEIFLGNSKTNGPNYKKAFKLLILALDKIGDDEYGNSNKLICYFKRNLELFI
jgi:hypothetical protein